MITKTKKTADRVTCKIFQDTDIEKIENEINDFLHNSDNIKVLKGMFNICCDNDNNIVYVYTLFYATHIELSETVRKSYSLSTHNS